MTQQHRPAGLPPWYRGYQAPGSTSTPRLPPTKELRPAPTGKRRLQQKRATKRTATTNRPHVRRGPPVKARRAQAQSQPRDTQGRFVEKGNLLTRLFEPTPRLPTRLKKVKKQAPNVSPPHAQAKRKKPVPERNFLGHGGAIFNGNYARWRQRSARQQAALQSRMNGYDLPKKRVRRRRKPRYLDAPIQQPRRDALRRLFPF